MKTFKLMFVVLALCMFTVVASFGADAVAVAPVVPSGFQAIINWMIANQVIVGMLLVGILDFIFAINPAWQSNTVFHMFYLFAMKIAKKPTDVTPAV